MSETSLSSVVPGRIAVIGAGSVGATITYAVMLRGLASQIVLIDVDERKCEGEVKDLNHGLRFVPSVRVSAGRIADCRRSEIVIVTAGAKQKPGQSRLELAKTNIALFRELIPQIASEAPEAIVLVVSNPVDVLTYAATLWHPQHAGRVLGSGTVLDSSRFVTLIAERLGVWVGNVHAAIVGEHGDSELPLWSSAHVGSVPLSAFRVRGRPAMTAGDREQIMRSVRSAAAEIIAAKGATNWAIGVATARIVEAIRRDENAVLTVSRWLEDYEGISNVALSVPCLVNRLGADPLMPAPMNDEELEGLRTSAEVLRHARQDAGL